MKTDRHFLLAGGISLVISSLAACAPAPGPGASSSIPATDTARSSAACAQVGGLRLPPGFCATIFADSVGAARHIVVAPNGDVFVNLQAARPRSPVAGIAPGQLALRDTDRDGRADVRERFGSGGNTGIALHNGFLYADLGTTIVRYPMRSGELKPSGPAEIVVTGLPGGPGHRSRNFAIAPGSALYVNLGSATNSCQVSDRTAGSPGVEGCPELLARAGVWMFDANKLGQTPSLASRHATGIRNALALSLDPAGTRLYAVPHGRDQLAGSWPALFTAAQNAVTPSEELIQIDHGDDFGWPFCYHDPATNKLILAPEYGGDGKTEGRCASGFKSPLAAFPAHWAPNAMLFYSGTQFPSRYSQGLFVAFHGSWNRAPEPQGGFNVVFLPFRDGRALSQFEVFADGFAGAVVQPNGAEHRPSGLAQGPDGALFITDDVGGRIWRVTYGGPK